MDRSEALTEGVQPTPEKDAEQRRRIDSFLQGEALEISSQLASLVENAEEISKEFNLASIRRLPALATLMRFLSHAMRVAGSKSIADEVEDLLRASLVYPQTRKLGQKHVERLVSLCRAYLTEVKGKQKGILRLADKTGFATGFNRFWKRNSNLKAETSHSGHISIGDDVFIGTPGPRDWPVGADDATRPESAIVVFFV